MEFATEDQVLYSYQEFVTGIIVIEDGTTIGNGRKDDYSNVSLNPILGFNKVFLFSTQFGLLVYCADSLAWCINSK